MPVTLTVNDKPVTVPEGSSVLDAVNSSGTTISQLCKDPDMKPIGACRTCLVQITGMRGFPASCSVPTQEGMEVQTDSADVERIRRGVIELTLGMVPGKTDDFRQLTTAAQHVGVTAQRWIPREREKTDESNPVFNIAMDSCILCGRCAQACQDSHQFIGAIDFLGVGRNSRIGTFLDQPLAESICTTCGQCLSVCPTGAIAVKEPETVNPQTSVKSTCPYCGVGCGIQLQVDGNDEIVEVLDDPDNLSSAGMLCVKGRFGSGFVHSPDRLTTPLIKEGDEFRPASWDEALDLIVDRFAGYLGNSFATLCSAKATNEDGYIQAEVRPAADAVQQYRPLHPAVSLSLGRGDVDLLGQRGDQQFLYRLRGRRLPRGYRLRPDVQSSCRRFPHAPGCGGTGGQADRHQPSAHRHV